MERHYGRDRSRPIYWTLVLGQVSSIFARWPVYRLRLGRWDNSYVERHYGRDRRKPIYWTDGSGRVYGVLARWSVHCLIRTRTNSHIECYDRKDGNYKTRRLH